MYPLRNPAIKSTLLPDGYLVLFNTKTDWALTLNPSAALVWDFCDGAHSLPEIVAELAAATESADKAVLKAEVESLVQQLARDSLLTVADAMGAGQAGDA